MREIRFRAWVYEFEKMVDVKGIDFIGEEIEIFEDEIYGDINIGFNYIELMQYTGLKDKNGVEIYEGDYIEIYQDIYETFSEGSLECNDLYVWKEPVDTLEEKGVVMFGKGAFAVDEWLLNWFEENELEVIGNIYENPQLLEVK